MAVSDDGRVFTWGLDGCATDGAIPDQMNAYQPRVVSGQLEGQKVVGLDAGVIITAECR